MKLNINNSVQNFLPFERVLDKFKDMRTNDIVETMHNEPEYVNTKMCDVMTDGRHKRD